MTFNLPVPSLGLFLLAEVAANPEQAQEHKPLPRLFGCHAQWVFPLEGETGLPWPNCSRKHQSRLEVFPNETTPMFASPFCSAEPQASKHGACQPPAPTEQPLFRGQHHLQQPTPSSCPRHPWGADMGPHAALFATVAYAPWKPGARCQRWLPLHPSPTPNRPWPCSPGWLLKRLVLGGSCKPITYLFESSTGRLQLLSWCGVEAFLHCGVGKADVPFRSVVHILRDFPPTSTLLSLHN